MVTLSVETPEKIIVSKAKNREFKEWYQGACGSSTKL